MRRKKATNPATDKIANLIVRRAILLQTRWANFMQRNSERLSEKNKKYILLIFSILTGLYSCFIIIQSFTGDAKHPFTITNIHLPKAIHEVSKPPPVSEKEYLQIERYKKYMDSCGLPIRPGLADSIHQLEKIYQSSKK